MQSLNPNQQHPKESKEFRRQRPFSQNAEHAGGIAERVNVVVLPTCPCDFKKPVLVGVTQTPKKRSILLVKGCH